MSLRNGRLPSYLTTNGYTYCFRIRVPHDLTLCFGRSQIKFSLATDSVLKARTKALSLAERYKQLFHWMRCNLGKMTDDEIQDFAEIFVDRAGDREFWEGGGCSRVADSSISCQLKRCQATFLPKIKHRSL
jgi:hypothetical protein